MIPEQSGNALSRDEAANMERRFLNSSLDTMKWGSLTVKFGEDGTRGGK